MSIIKKWFYLAEIYTHDRRLIIDWPYQLSLDDRPTMMSISHNIPYNPPLEWRLKRTINDILSNIANVVHFCEHLPDGELVVTHMCSFLGFVSSDRIIWNQKSLRWKITEPSHVSNIELLWWYSNSRSSSTRQK